MQKVIVIIGPTGIGKTKLSIELAKYLNTEIISGDSVQVYKHLNIGSAKVTLEEMQGIKHYLVDELELTEDFSVKDFQSTARELISDINSRNMLPIICGGTGHYIKSTLYNYEFKDEESIIINDDLEDKSAEELITILNDIDSYSKNIDIPLNKRRIIRAIRYFNQHNQSFYLNNKKDELLYKPLIIHLILERSKLYEIINNRVDKMIDNGLLEEVKNLHSKNIRTKPLNSIGYKELYDYLDGHTTLEEAISNIKQNSRRLAKRQLTYINNQLACTKIESNIDNFSLTIDNAIKVVKEYLDEN